MMPDYKRMIGTKDKPLELKTPPGTSSYTMHVEEKDGQDILVCTVGSTVLHYDIRCIDDLAAMLKKHGDWIPLSSKDVLHGMSADAGRFLGRLASIC
jgi:hypothetical protein